MERGARRIRDSETGNLKSSKGAECLIFDEICGHLTAQSGVHNGSKPRNFTMTQLNSTELSRLSTRVRAQEAQVIKSYCTSKGITLDNFMRDVALADVHLGTTLRNEGVLTIIWSSGAFMPPRTPMRTPLC
jgi:hypothetical protein